MVETGFSESGEPINLGSDEGTLIMLPPNAPPVVLKKITLTGGKETKIVYEPPPYEYLTPEVLAKINDDVMENIGIPTGDGFCEPPSSNARDSSSNAVSGAYEGCRVHGGDEFAMHLMITERPQSGDSPTAADIVGYMLVFEDTGSGDLEQGYITNCNSCDGIRVVGSKGDLSFFIVEEIPGENNDVQCHYAGTVIPTENKITGDYTCSTGPINSGGGEWEVYRTGDVR